MKHRARFETFDPVLGVSSTGLHNLETLIYREALFMYVQDAPLIGHDSD